MDQVEVELRKLRDAVSSEMKQIYSIMKQNLSADLSATLGEEASELFKNKQIPMLNSLESIEYIKKQLDFLIQWSKENYNQYLSTSKAKNQLNTLLTQQMENQSKKEHQYQHLKVWTIGKCFDS